MENKNRTKLNDGCLKIFELLNLLYEDEAQYQKVIDIFKDDFNEDQSTNNIQVVLNKYMNALKVFGIQIEKENNKFKLRSNLYSVPFSTDDLKAINILTTSANNFPNEQISKELKKFIQVVKNRMNNENKNTLNNLNSKYNFSFCYSDLKYQIEECEKICKEKYIIEIVYLKNNKEIKCKCTPKEVVYTSKEVYLQIYDYAKAKNTDIKISKILSIIKLPQIANSQNFTTTTVVYKLKNRLAKTYKVKENEYSDGYDENGNLIIVNRNEPHDKLLNRLMRYTYNCEIISPKILRNEMIDLINKTIENYDK